MAIRSVDGNLMIDCTDVHDDARMRLSFQRTLRVPDDGTPYNLPPGLGNLDVRRVGDTSTRFVLPLWQSEACWVQFNGRYPFLITMSSGAIDVLTGEPWSPRPDFDRENYMEIPTQPWLDGFVAEDGVVRQFVAAPLGRGLTVEEQLSSEPASGDIRIAVYPMTAAAYESRAMKRDRDVIICFSAPAPDMGLAAGGRIAQSIAAPELPRDVWDLDSGQFFTVSIINSEQWERLTGHEPRPLPLSAADYTREGMPWFDHYDESVAHRRGSSAFDGVTSLVDADPSAVPENKSVETPTPIHVST